MLNSKLKKKFFILLFIFKAFFPEISYGEIIYSDSAITETAELKINFKVLFPLLISETSGLVLTDGKLWTHNDKGGLAAIYNIDTATGNIIQTVFIDNYSNIDWEDIAADSANIYVGDFGNNLGVRKNLRILVIEKSSIPDKPKAHVKAKVINFNYGDQKSFTGNNLNNFDCESMFALGDSLYLFSKDRGDNFTRVYKLSKTPGDYILYPYTSYYVNGRICGASYDKENNKLALIGYMPGTTHAFLWLMNGFNGTDFFSGSKHRFEIGENKLHWKTEGVAFVNKNRLFVSCETTESQKAGLFVFDFDK